MAADDEDIVQVKRASSSYWSTHDPILRAGEHGFERNTGKFKIGNGVSRWSQLPYFLPETAVAAAIQEAIDQLPASEGGGVSIQTFNAHVNSLTPHPVYDDAPSLALLYESLKV